MLQVMKKRIKIYSFILLMANIFLFAHSFIPHEHNHVLPNELEKFTCQCSSCSSVEISSKSSSDKGNCDCCSKGSKGCFISNGYLSQHSNEVSEILLYIITPEVIIPIPSEHFTTNSYSELYSSPPARIEISGIGMRAPPQLFS